VTLARASNVIPFPKHDGRACLGFEQIRLHVEALDRELLTLSQANFLSSGEWARQTATPIVRTEYIRNYLKAASAVLPAAMAAQHRRRRRLARACNELLTALSVTRISLTRIAEPALGPARRQVVLEELPVHRERQQRIFRKLANCWPT
jgi:hypothetical protein